MSRIEKVVFHLDDGSKVECLSVELTSIDSLIVDDTDPDSPDVRLSQACLPSQKPESVTLRVTGKDWRILCEDEE